MEEKDKIYLATKAFKKGWSYDQLYYGDDLYGKEELADEIWEIVQEIKAVGTDRFYEENKEYNLY